MIYGLPEKLKELRLKYGFSQKDVACRIGITTSIVSGYETGERTPSTENLLALSYLYNCSTDFLLGKKSVDLSHSLDTTGLNDCQRLALYNLIQTINNN